MWPFSKKQNLPGFKRDDQGNLIFELTEEEKQAVQKVFDVFEGYAVNPKVADEVQRGVTAQGLFHYAKEQIMLSGFDQNRSKKKEFIDKAIASISKAYSFCPLPIYMYDLACFMEMNGNK